jgi:membrane-bound ClpP family serine protease
MSWEEVIAGNLILLLVLALIAAVALTIRSAIYSFASGIESLLRALGFAGESAPPTPDKEPAIARVVEPFKPGGEDANAVGRVFLWGEIWSAHADPSLAREISVDDLVEVVRQSGLHVVVVRKIEDAP